MEIQQFETEALAQLTPTIQEYKITYKPIFATLGEPIDILHCDNAEITCAFKELSGAWSYIQARPGTPNSKRAYSVRFGTLAIPNTPVRLFKGTTLIKEEKTDEHGKVAFTLTASEPTKDNYQVTLLPYPAPVKNPLQEQFTLTVWLVTCKITNMTDRWWRLAGRTFEIALPRIFWRELPASVIGLTAPYGTQTFVDIVPVFNDKNITLEYGISAWCNTPEPYPTADRCIAYRRNTWWHFEIEAYNKDTRKVVSGDLNIDRHLKITLTTDNMTGEIIRPAGAET